MFSLLAARYFSWYAVGVNGNDVVGIRKATAQEHAPFALIVNMTHILHDRVGICNEYHRHSWRGR